MSVSKAQLEDFASKINNHPAYDEVIKRMQESLFSEWVTATDDRRKIIADLVSNMGFLITEINKVCGHIDADKPINNDEDE